MTCKRYIILSIAITVSLTALAQSVQSGKASYYTKSWTGRKTANGELLHHDSLTCAHKTYPFGTLLKVTNLLNGMEVIVRVTDRGPYVKGRVVDLSWGAAKAIGMLSQGVAPVSVERLKETNVPFKPEEDDPNIPKLEFELADIAPTGIVPVWQQDTIIDNKKVQRSMRRTTVKVAQTTNTSTTATTPQPQQKSSDPIEEINKMPNKAKAYLKRESKK